MRLAMESEKISKADLGNSIKVKKNCGLDFMNENQTGKTRKITNTNNHNNDNKKKEVITEQ